MPQTVEQSHNFNLKEGHWFFFEVDGNQFITHKSGWRGREQVWVNDASISNKLPWSRYASHRFTFNDTPFEVAFEIHNLFKNKTACTLVRRGELIGHVEQDIRIKTGKVRKWFLANVPMLIASMAGVAAGLWLVRALLEG